MNERFDNYLSRAQTAALVIGLIAAGASAFGAFYLPRQFFFSYLYAFLFWLGLSLGCLAVLMIHFLAGGRWGWPTRRFLEAGAVVLPLMLLLFVPVFLGLHDLYPWARPEEIAKEKVLQLRHAYFKNWAFILRQCFYLIVFGGIALRLRSLSLQQDTTPDAEPTRKARFISGPGLVAYGLLGTFACVDWIMSLELHWFSTMFAVTVMIGQILTAFAFSVVMLMFMKREPSLDKVINKTQLHQLGNLLLAFVMFWTYVCFGQLLIIYSGDIPHELEWYFHRIAGSWKIVLAVIALFHFFLPFYLLLFRAVKKNIVPLTTLSFLLVVTQIVDTYWMVVPAYHKTSLQVSWIDFATCIAIGGLWVACFLWRLRAAPLLPQQDPGMQFAFVYVEP